MKYEIFITQRAHFEINQSIEWYNEQKKGLGKQFYNELKSCIKHIKKNPLAFEKKYKHFHVTPLEIFPFNIIYFIDNPDKIIITAVFHTSREPENSFESE